MRRHLLAVVAVVWAAAACTKVNPDYCADAGAANGYACSKLDAGRDAPVAVDATDAKDGGEGGEMRGDASHDATEAPAERPRCTDMTCGNDGGAPICDVDAGLCRGCATDGECLDKSTSTPFCVSGQCYACKTDDQCAGATTPICAANVCRGCVTSAECMARSTATTAPACALSSGKCVQCVGDGDCKGTTPICNTTANTCRPCASDSECPADPGVCMADGHCASTGEVIFVDGSANSASCPVADGTSAKPYCAPIDGVSHLAMGRNVIVLRGNSTSAMVLATTGISPVVIGKTNASSVAGSVPAIASAGITVNSDTVLIRDLTVNAGTGSSSEGVAVTGASTKVTLLRVTVSLGMGLGVDAESGATLAMDECYVTNNSVGGVYVSGAGYSIQNTVIAGNGYGIQFSAALATNSQLRFDTIVNNQAAVTCDHSNPETVANSIVTGTAFNCNVVDSQPSATFSSMRPFHLTAHLACPTVPAAGTFPDHDIDGDARSGTIDCGADQFQ